MRNKPCPCGSGKKFRDCCMNGKKKAPSVHSGASQTNDPPISASPLEGFNPFEAYKQLGKGDSKYDAELLGIISSKLRPEDVESALLSIGAHSVLPENQSMEMRFVQLAQFVIPSTDGSRPRGVVDISSLSSAYDKRYAGRHKMLEIDTQESVYISWVSFGENTYKVLTSTIEESELYYNDTTRRLDIIKEITPSIGKVTNTIEWFAEKVDDFIRTNQLDANESKSGKDYKSEIMTVTNNIDALSTSLNDMFTIPKKMLEKDREAILKAISLRPEEFKRERQEPPQLYAKPLIDYDDHFFAPFPQLVIPALHEHGFKLFSTQAAKNDIANAYELSLHDQALLALRKEYGPKKVMEKLKVNGQHWADFCIIFDGKLIFINLAVADANNLQGTVDLVEDTFVKARDIFESSESAVATSLQGLPSRFREIYDHTEHIVLTIFDYLSYEGMIASKGLDDKTLYNILPFASWKFILEQSKNPLEFIRYLRSQDDLHNRKIKRLGITTLDSYIDYKEGNHQLREVERDPDLLMIDMTGGARFVSNSTREQRNGVRVIRDDGIRVVARKHWKNFYGYTKDEILRIILQDSEIRCIFNIELPGQETSPELAHSSYIVFDSLCYFLDENIKKIELLSGLAGGLVINVTMDDSIDEIKASTKKTTDRIELSIKVGPNAYKRFLDQNNSGERWILEEFAKAINIEKPSQWVDQVKPLSSERNFQTKTYAVGHKAYEYRPNPIQIEESEQWWVDEVISSAVLEAGIKPGMYKDSREIGKLAPKLMDASKKALEEKLKEYRLIDVITMAYEQLEMAYVANEHDHLSALADREIRDITQEDYGKLTLSEQQFTQLTFANRYLLELALQSKEGGGKLLTKEAYMELLSLAERVVDMDFFGDTIYLGLQPGAVYISKRGYPGVESQSPGGKKLAQKHLDSAISTAGYKANTLSEGLKPKDAPARVKELAEPFKETFGFTIEEWTDVVKSILEFINELSSPIVTVSRRMLTDKLSSLSSAEPEVIEKILDEMTLSQEILNGVDISPSMRFWREERILNKPLVLLPASQMLIFSRTVVERYAMSYFERLTTGRLDLIKNHPELPLSKMIMQQVNEDAIDFENEVDQVLRAQGYKTKKRVTSVGGLSIDKLVGEIDVLAWDQKNNKLIVVEAKNNTPSRSPIEIKTEIDNYFGKKDEIGYFDKLEKKYNWIQEHPEQVRKEFSIPEGVKYSLEGILISKSILASAELRKPKFKTMKLVDFVNEN